MKEDGKCCLENEMKQKDKYPADFAWDKQSIENLIVTADLPKLPGFSETLNCNVQK